MKSYQNWLEIKPSVSDRILLILDGEYFATYQDDAVEIAKAIGGVTTEVY